MKLQPTDANEGRIGMPESHNKTINQIRKRKFKLVTSDGDVPHTKPVNI